MTKKEAISALRSGSRVTHPYFGWDEWMELRGNVLYFEDGMDMQLSEFFDIRNSDGWEDGYTVVV
jgi:hypothetical protein